MRVLGGLILLLLLSGQALAQGSVKAAPYPYTSLPTTSAGYQQITATSSAASLTVPSGATIAEFCVETAAIRYRDDGTDPSTTVGMPAAAGTCFAYSGPLRAFRFIAQTGSPVINVLYYF
jgi:hypothetical protein